MLALPENLSLSGFISSLESQNNGALLVAGLAVPGVQFRLKDGSGGPLTRAG